MITKKRITFLLLGLLLGGAIVIGTITNYSNGETKNCEEKTSGGIHTTLTFARGEIITIDKSSKTLVVQLEEENTFYDSMKIVLNYGDARVVNGTLEEGQIVSFSAFQSSPTVIDRIEIVKE